MISRAGTNRLSFVHVNPGNSMKNHVGVLACLLLAFAGECAASTITVNDNSDPSGTGACPATCSLRQAITAANGGDTIVFAPGLSSPINLAQGELLIGKALTIQGPGATKLTISGQNNSRVFNLTAAATITDLEIADGAVTGSNGSNGADTSGATGGSGDSVGGACVLVANGIAAVLDRVAVRHCTAVAGNGGTGGSGTNGGFPFGGAGGTGGNGGDAVGAAIAIYGSLSLLHSSVVDAHAAGGGGGNGGTGGAGGPSAQQGFGGMGGVGGAAEGGAVAALNGGGLHIANSTIAESSGTGGGGGQPGAGTPAFPGGSGGYAAGGLLYVENGVAPADVEFSTLANGSVAGGAGSPDGFPVANAINAGSTLTVLSSIVVGAQGDADLCYGTVTAATGSANLSEATNNTANPSTCNNFSLNATFAQTLRPLDVTTTPWPGHLPIWHSPAINAAANCQDLAAQNVSADQHSTARPQGAACDLGAIEADYIFVDGFE
jgi:hypothetical protein